MGFVRSIFSSVLCSSPSIPGDVMRSDLGRSTFKTSTCGYCEIILHWSRSGCGFNIFPSPQSNSLLRGKWCKVSSGDESRRNDDEWCSNWIRWWQWESVVCDVVNSGKVFGWRWTTVVFLWEFGVRQVIFRLLTFHEVKAETVRLTLTRWYDHSHKTS
jgi:hypothetical protein